ncbi:hypothetical protein [Nostoc sp.]|uniref:hypothetical protein n=1 Tax=Nostoc sp. TaxID=1180 RepID=UPI002FF96784
MRKRSSHLSTRRCANDKLSDHRTLRCCNLEFKCRVKGDRLLKKRCDPSSEHEIPSSEHEIPSSEHELPSSEHELPSSEHELPSSERELPSSEYERPSSDVGFTY